MSSNNNDYQSMQNEYAALHNQFISATEITKQLQHNNEILQQQLFDKNNQLEEIRRKHLELQKRYNSDAQFFKQTKIELEDQLKRLDEDSRSKYKEFIEKIEMEAPIINDDNRSNDSESRSYKDQLEQIQTELKNDYAKKIQKIFDDSQEKLQGYNDLYNRKIEEQTRNLKAELKQAIMDRDSFHEKCEKFELSLHKIQSQNDILKKERDDAIANKNQDKIQLYNEFTIMGKKLLDNDTEIKTLKKELNRITSQLLIKDEEITNLKCSNEQLNAKSDNLSKDIDNLTKEIEDLQLLKQTEVEHIRTELDTTASSSATEINRLTHELSSLSDANQKLQDEVTDLQRRLAYMNREFDGNRNKLRIEMQSRAVLQKQLSDLQDEFKGTSVKLTQSEKINVNYQEKMNIDDKTILELNQKLAHSKEQVKSLEDKTLSLLSEMDQLKNQIVHVSKELQATKNNETTLTKQLIDMRTADGNPETLSKKLIESETKYGQLYQTHIELVRKYKSLKNDAKQLKECANTRKNKLKLLEEQLYPNI